MSNTRNIAQMEPWFDDKEAEAVSAYMRGGGWVTEFQKTKDFESQIAAYTGAKHCIVTNNGTITLIMALRAVGVGPGDEVIVPNLTMIATPNAAALLGAKPVFVDVEPKTLCLDFEKTVAAITPRTKAVFHVSYNAKTNDLDQFAKLCKSRGIAFLEDAAQSLGSTFKGRALGTIGDIGSFSFSAPKIISTGQGGALVTNDDGLALKLRKLKDFGRTSGGIDIHDSIGFNFKFTDVQAVIGIEQMKKLKWRVERKKAIHRIFETRLSDVPQVEMLKTDFSTTAPWFTDIFVDKRDELMAHMKARGVGTRHMYPPVNTQEAYNVAGDFPVTRKYSLRGLWLPSSTKLTDDDVHYVCDQVADFYAKGPSR